MVTLVTSARIASLPEYLRDKVHLDGYDQSKFLTTVSGSAASNNGVRSARSEFFYSDDDGLLVGMRLGDYK